MPTGYLNSIEEIWRKDGFCELLRIVITKWGGLPQTNCLATRQSVSLFVPNSATRQKG